MFERRYTGMPMRGRDFPPLMGRRDPMPLPPQLGGMRGMGSNGTNGSMGRGGGGGGGYDGMFSRRTPPPRNGNLMNRYK